MTATPTIRWRSFFLHKDGNDPDEYEDAFAGEPKAGRFAVADGASESSFAACWAKLLVEGFVGKRENVSVEWLSSLQQRWAEEVDHLELDWFAEEKRLIGAFATFLGLAFGKPQEGQGGRWKAVAVGDACLFQIQDDGLASAFPLHRSEDFGNVPPLLGSRPKPGHTDLEIAQQKMGSWKKEDRFFLTTDALAQWFLWCHENHQKPWASLQSKMDEPNPTAALTAHIEQLRSNGELKNDDVTLLVIDL